MKKRIGVLIMVGVLVVAAGCASLSQKDKQAIKDAAALAGVIAATIPDAPPAE